MNLTKKQAEFYVAILVLCIIVAAAIMLVDFGIKAAILEQSTKLRETIEAEEVRRSGHKPEKPATDGVDTDPSIDAPISPPLLVDNAAGMEAANVPNGTKETADNSTTRNTKSRRPTRPRGIPTGDK